MNILLFVIVPVVIGIFFLAIANIRFLFMSKKHHKNHKLANKINKGELIDHPDVETLPFYDLMGRTKVVQRIKNKAL